MSEHGSQGGSSGFGDTAASTDQLSKEDKIRISNRNKAINDNAPLMKFECRQITGFNSLHSITYKFIDGKRLYVAVGTQFTLMYSYDSIQWNRIQWYTGETFQEIYAVKYIKELDLFVAAGNGIILHSTDPLTEWTSHTNSGDVVFSGIEFFGIEYEPIKKRIWFVGKNNTILYSNDCIIFKILTYKFTDKDGKPDFLRYILYVPEDNKLVITGDFCTIAYIDLSASELTVIRVPIDESIISEWNTECLKIEQYLNKTNKDFNTAKIQQIVFNPDKHLYVAVGNFNACYYTHHLIKDKTVWKVSYFDDLDRGVALQAIKYDRKNKTYVCGGWNGYFAITKDVEIGWKRCSTQFYKPEDNIALHTQFIAHYTDIGFVFICDNYIVHAREYSKTKNNKTLSEYVFPIGYIEKTIIRHNLPNEYLGFGEWEEDFDENTRIYSYTRLK